MSIRIIVEVFDHYRDFGLTPGERDDLLVIAENVNDMTRETYGSIHQDYIYRRANKTAETWRNAIGKLKKKGVLQQATKDDGRKISGHVGQIAVYRIPILCPEHPHDGYLGFCTRSERVTPQVTLSMGHPTGDPLTEQDAERVTSQVEEGHLTGGNGSPDRCERVTPQVTPSPLTPLAPQNPPPPSARADALGTQTALVADDLPAKPKPRRASTRKPAGTAGEDPDFVEFWAVYPRRKDRGEARKAWAQALKKGADPAHMIGAAKRYRDDPRRKAKGNDFTKYPASWLRAESYDDEAEATNHINESTGAWDV